MIRIDGSLMVDSLDLATLITGDLSTVTLLATRRDALLIAEHLLRQLNQGQTQITVQLFGAFTPRELPDAPQ